VNGESPPAPRRRRHTPLATPPARAAPPATREQVRTQQRQGATPRPPPNALSVEFARLRADRPPGTRPTRRSPAPAAAPAIGRRPPGPRREAIRTAGPQCAPRAP